MWPCLASSCITVKVLHSPLMAFPVASLLSAAAPLVMNALELYRRRNEATVAHLDTDPSTISRDAVRERLIELEAADLEQTKLISELSRQIEALARSAAAAQRERRQLQRLLWVVGAVAVASVALSVWTFAA